MYRFSAQNNTFYCVSAGVDGRNVFVHGCESPKGVYFGLDDVRQKL